MKDDAERKRNFLIFLVFLIVFSYMALRGVLPGIAWGLIAAFIWHPIDARIARLVPFNRMPSLRAAVSLILFVICITIPMAYMLSALASELMNAFESVTAYVATIRENGMPDLSKYLPSWISERIMPLVLDTARLINMAASAAQSAGSLIRSMSEGIIRWTSAFLFQGFMSIVTMYFALRDGHKAIEYIKELMPMTPEKREEFAERTNVVMVAVAHGTILTVAVQAMLGGLGWYVAGLSDAFLATGAMFIFGMVPMGMTIVWLPGAIYLIATGSLVSGIGLFAWGAGVVSMIDSFLRPFFAGSGSNIPTPALILGLSGGIVAWGLLGVFLGPLVLALCKCALDMYKSEMS